MSTKLYTKQTIAEANKITEYVNKRNKNMKLLGQEIKMLKQWFSKLKIITDEENETVKVVGNNIKGEVVFGESKCNSEYDYFDKSIGQYFALCRALNIKPDMVYKLDLIENKPHSTTRLNNIFNSNCGGFILSERL